MPESIYKLSMADIKGEEEDKNMFCVVRSAWDHLQAEHEPRMADIKEEEKDLNMFDVVGSARDHLQAEHFRH